MKTIKNSLGEFSFIRGNFLILLIGWLLIDFSRERALQQMLLLLRVVEVLLLKSLLFVSLLFIFRLWGTLSRKFMLLVDWRDMVLVFG